MVAAISKKRPRSKMDPVPSRLRKEKRMFVLNPDSVQYSYGLSIHSMWNQYLTAVVATLKTVDAHRLTNVMHEIDLCGAFITVVQSKDPSLVGIRGIIVKESSGVFHAVNELDVVKEIPKKGCILECDLPASIHFKIVIYGNLCIGRNKMIPEAGGGAASVSGFKENKSRKTVKGLDTIKL
jgi:RNase P/RNase MRP subunit p29